MQPAILFVAALTIAMVPTCDGSDVSVAVCPFNNDSICTACFTSDGNADVCTGLVMDRCADEQYDSECRDVVAPCPFTQDVTGVDNPCDVEACQANISDSTESADQCVAAILTYCDAADDPACVGTDDVDGGDSGDSADKVVIFKFELSSEGQPTQHELSQIELKIKDIMGGVEVLVTIVSSLKTTTWELLVQITGLTPAQATTAVSMFDEVEKIQQLINDAGITGFSVAAITQAPVAMTEGTWTAGPPSGCATACGTAAGSGTAGVVTCSTGSDDGCPGKKPLAETCPATSDCDDDNTVMFAGVGAGAAVAITTAAVCWMRSRKPKKGSDESNEGPKADVML